MDNPNLKKYKYTVGILIYHRNKDLVNMARDCLASVIKSCPRDETQIIICDNGSPEQYPWDELCDIYIRFNKNLGISAGWNSILKLAKGEYINILGDDTIVREGWLQALKKAMDMPNAGLANVHVQHLPAGEGIVENYKWFSHACVMLTQNTIDKVGYYDQDSYFPANFEDHDYITRVMKSGLKCYVNYGMTIQHREGATVHSPDLSAHFNRLKEVFMKKHGFDNQDVFCGDKPFPF